MLVRRTASTLLAGGVIAGSVLVGATPALANHEGDIFAITTNNELLRYDPASPSTIIEKARISGLQLGENVIGVDFRSRDGEIYGITTDERIFRIDYRPGVGVFGQAQLVSTLFRSPTTPGPAIVIDSNIGYDFNPVADRLRVVKENGQNLRIDVDTGEVFVDTNLAYASGDTNAGRPPKVTAVAYTNPDNNPSTGTTLYDIDPGQTGRNDIISKQVTANSGQLFTLGTTGFNSPQLLGYDIGLDGVGYLAAIGGDGNTLYTVTFDGAENPTTTLVDLVAEDTLFRDHTIALPNADNINPFEPVGPTPVVPEFPFAALAPVLGLGLAGAVIVFRRRSEA